jgi:hypothetical protein
MLGELQHTKLHRPHPGKPTHKIPKTEQLELHVRFIWRNLLDANQIATSMEGELKVSKNLAGWMKNKSVAKNVITLVSVTLSMLRKRRRNCVVEPLMMRVKNTTPPVKNTNWCI